MIQFRFGSRRVTNIGPLLYHLELPSVPTLGLSIPSQSISSHRIRSNLIPILLLSQCDPSHPPTPLFAIPTCSTPPLSKPLSRLRKTSTTGTQCPLQSSGRSTFPSPHTVLTFPSPHPIPTTPSPHTPLIPSSCIRTPSLTAPLPTQLDHCDKKLRVSLQDSGSMGSPSTQALIAELSSDHQPNVIVGPGRSAASIPTATVAGVLDIPQISYWATSKSLDGSDFPRFMRTVPTDDAVAFSLCQFWEEDMGYSRAAMLYSNDAYGEAYKESLFGHCLARGISLTTFPYDASDREAARQQVAHLSSTNIRVVLWVGSQQGLATIMDEAYKQGLFSGTKGLMWVVTDGASPADSAALPPGSTAAINAHSGMLRLIAAGEGELGGGEGERVYA